MVMLVITRPGTSFKAIAGSGGAKKVGSPPKGSWTLRPCPCLPGRDGTGNIGMNIWKMGDEYGANIVMYENYENHIPTTISMYISDGHWENPELLGVIVLRSLFIGRLVIFQKGSRTPRRPFYICFPTLGSPLPMFLTQQGLCKSLSHDVYSTPLFMG